MLTLYQFPISHFCEKVRWALNFKQLEYQTENLLPALHILKTRKLGARSYVPILQHDDRIIQGSGRIISYLDEQFPENSLTPEDPVLKKNALDWEDYADKEIGPHLRRCCYHILLDYPDVVIPFFTHNGPWYGKYVMPLMFPKLKVKMRKMMNINEESAQISKIKIELSLDKLNDHFKNHKFLTGNTFTRADLSTAALLAPICRPKKYGLNWPERFPQPLEDIVEEFKEQTQWVHDFYQQYR